MRHRLAASYWSKLIIGCCLEDIEEWVGSMFRINIALIVDHFFSREKLPKIRNLKWAPVGIKITIPNDALYSVFSQYCKYF